jgi:predicted NUDIX family phosphoesterase
MTVSIDPVQKAELKRKYPDEQVFVVPFMFLNNIPDKFTRTNHTLDIWNRYDNSGKYIFRHDAEMNPAFQQIIPYVLIKNSFSNKYFVANRLAGEKRLIDKISLGFGGHINPCDGTKDVLFYSLFREMHEELDIEPVGPAEFVGYVRGLTTPTNDHTGCVFVVKTESCAIKETDNLEGLWMTIEELEKNYFKFESWAKYIIDYLVSNNGIF